MLNEIICALRQRCPTFAGRVAGAAEFTAVPDNGALDVPAAYVLPLDDKPDDAVLSGGYRQPLRDSFGIVVALDNSGDYRGETASRDAVRRIRPELFRALLGWEPDDDHGPITYEGGQIQDMNRALLWYRLEFGADTVIDLADTYSGRIVEEAPALETVTVTFGGVDHEDAALGPVDTEGHPVPGVQVTLEP